MNRGKLLQIIAGLGAAALPGVLPAYASTALAPLEPTPNGERLYDFVIDELLLKFPGRTGNAIAINGSVPGPLLRAREGETVVIRVTNRLVESSSIHWHGLLVPNAMDGVPGVTFRGIDPGETFVYRLPIKQNGTYWYHSHSGLQEQIGLYGPIILEPTERDHVGYDRDYVVMLSDWTFDNPRTLIEKLRKQAGYYNFQQPTGLSSITSAWARMRMDPTDFADISSYAYTFLMNGLASEENWTGLFKSGEKLRLRIIGGSAMTIFDVRIPGLPMTVVQVDGANIQPVIVDELRIAPGETYDVVVQPPDERAYTVFAEANDRSGYVSGTLATREGMVAPIPARRPPPRLTMADMGMVMNEKRMSGMNMRSTANTLPIAPSLAAYPPGSPPVLHGPDTHGIENQTAPMVETNRLADPGPGLENTGHRVLTYADLRSFTPQQDRREPTNAFELHLTGNMERYMWSFDGEKYSEAGAFQFRRGERVRMILVNDTMMEHPIHLHGMYMELENGNAPNQPFKHTIRVKPAERLSVAITPEIQGDWALHCHLLLHLELGMLRVVQVTA